jgi:hypothetical protein
MQHQIPSNAAERLQSLQYALDSVLRCDVKTPEGRALYNERVEQMYVDLFGAASWLLPLARQGLQHAILIVNEEEHGG